MRQNTLFIKIFFTIALLLIGFFGMANTKAIKPNTVEIKKTTLSILAIDVSNFSTTATAACINTASTVTIASTTLTSGTYTVTYNLSGAQTAAGQTVLVDFSGGIGLFSTILLTPTGTTTITITKIDATTVSSGNTAAIVVSALPAQPSTITPSPTGTVCPGSSITYTVTNVAGITYLWSFPSGWLQTGGGTTNSVTVKAGTTAGNITVTPVTTATGCPGLSKILAATLTATITSTTSGSRTGSGTVQLGATASGGIIAWYDALTGGSAVTMAAPNYTTPSIKQSTTYYVQTTQSGCATPRVPVEAIVNAPQINVLGGLPPDIYNPAPTIPYGDTTPIASDWTDFGSVTTRTYTIENKGNLPLNITSITSSNTTNFNITTNPGPLTIQPGTNATFTVTFTSADALSKSATITINNNDNDEGTYTFKVQAIKITQEINVQGGTTLTNIASSNTVSTANGTDFAATKTQTYTIQNLGSAPLSITSISITTGGTYFSTPAVATTIASGDSYSFTVTFAPTDTTAKTGVITIANNDPNEGTYLINLKGTALAATIAFIGNVTTIPNNNNATNTNITNLTDFSTVATTRTFTIKNTGTLDLTISSFTSSNPEFSSTVPTPFTIPGGSSYSFAIKFTPTTAGAKSATFVFKYLTSTIFTLNLKGTGVAPSMNVKGNNVLIADGDSTPTTTDWTDFNNVVLGLFKTRTFQIGNTGTMNLNLTGTPTVKISGSSDFTVSPLPVSPVSGASTVDLNIKFTPTIIGTQTALVTIENNDAGTNKNPYTFVIKAKGNQPYFNSDTDTKNDNVDLDDDNDGVLDATEELDCNNANGPKTNYKFLNETFGSGERTSINTTYDAISTYCYEDGSLIAIPATVDCPKLGYNGTENDLDDGEYTVGSTAQISPGWSNDFWYKGKDHTSPSDPQGRMAIFNASNDPQTFYTAVITGILPNVPVTYNFWAINLDRSDAPGISTRKRPKIRVEFRDLNDVVLTYPSGPLVGQNIIISTGAIAPTSVGNAAGDWKQFKADLTLNVNAFKVVFINDEVGGSGNDLAIDDIAITQTLCDTDSDGIPNVFDLDSDNDGIEDIVEAGLGNLSLGNGLIQTITDTNGDGIDDTAATKTRLDSDEDTVPNYIDLDSDNDSVFDVDEGPGNSSDANFTNGDGDITGDGKGDGAEDETMRLKDVDGNGVTDTFGDGILPLYDKNPGVYGNLNHGTANANQATTYLKDTDSDGIPDYLDIMSNGTTFDIANNKLIYAPKLIDNIAPFGILDGTADIDKDGILDIFDTNTASFGSPRDLGKSLFLDFDGRNDYAQDLTAVLNGQPKASIMAWIDLNTAFSGAGFIVGQDNFQLRVTNAKYLEVFCNTKTVTSPTALDTKRWYHVAAVYDGVKVSLYLNGKNIGSIAATGSIVDASKLTIGRNPSSSSNFFKGKIDEVRVFNTGLTDNQVQRMVYQEIDPTSSKLKGTYITDKEIDQDLTTSTATLTFTNMLRYYRMDTYKDDILDDLTTTSADITGMKIYNTKNIYVQEAPMPFVTTADNVDLATSVTDASKDIQGTDVNNYSTIVNIKHNVTTTIDRTDIGLIVDAGKNLTVNGDKGLSNTWWLSLNGKIDLVGKSQLIQNSTSDLATTTTGYIERDQQGQANKYNYNYWSSPVSTINNPTNNNGYTVDSVMKDGINATPRNINWIAGYDGAAGIGITAVSLARYWLYKFESNTDAYANWMQITETSALRAGQGYTLKGSGAASNFTFVGKPNNGTISNTVGSGQLLLIGNPYPSAIDADKFLDDNLSTVERSAIDGTLYFWQHAPENNTHLLANYLGSYGVLNKSGGIAALTPSGINGSGTAASVPKRDIPVGQGFFVYGTVAGGSVQFRNSQRIFTKETDATSNTLFKTKANAKIPTVQYDNNDLTKTDTHKRIRLGYNTNNDYHRQVLLAFMDEKATSNIDYGYDGEILDDFPNDMFLLNGETQLVIEGEGHFDANASYPIGIKADSEGKVSFTIDGIENFDAEQPVFIYDNLTDTYNDISKNKFEVTLPAGDNNARFSLRFTDKTLVVAENNLDENAIKISHIQKGNILEINNQLIDTNVEKVTLYNISGQSIASWKIENQEQKIIQLPIRSISSGIYIAKLKTSKGTISKKIIVKQ